MVTIKDRAADLGIREMILGVLQSKDKSGKNIIHSSDFRTTITDLGFSMGSSIVENILIYCKLDESGNIDFSNLESQLVRERKLVNSQAKPAKVPASSSVGVSTRPWRADDVHKAKLEAERQILMINENHNEINGLYSALALHEITSRDAIDALEGLGINCTSAFLKTLQRMEFSDVTFSEFVRSLSAYYNEQADLDAQQVAAGGFARKPEDAGEQIGLRRKRATGNARNIVFYESALQDAPERRQRKQITATVGKGYRTYAAHDQRMFKTSAVQEILREDINADDPISGTIPLLSHAQHDMATGKMGKVVSGVDRVKYNIERKLQREQVFAALRKLDAGELTMEDFQDVLFSIGVDLPEALHARLSRAVIAGNIDLRQFIKLMDASLFKAQALEEIVHSPNHLDLVALFRDRLCRGSVGASVYVKLIQVFRIMDSDGDGLLTFQEFSFACKQMEITAGSNGISEDDLRLLFHAFDLQGCGTIDLRTFLHTLTQRVGKPHYTAQRAQTVRHAFELLTRLSGEPVLRVEEMVDAMDLSEHPAIVCSASHATEKECIHDLLQFFEYLSRVRFSSSSTNADEIPPASESLLTAYDTGVNFDAFEAYFQALSAAIDGFDVPVDPFVTAMRKCFGLSAEKQPAPPVFVVKKGSLAAQHNARMAGETTISPLVAAPRALQHHGDCITWRQAEDGVLEVEERRLEQQQGRKIYPQSLTRNFNTDVINWQRRQDNPPCKLPALFPLLSSRLSP